MKGCSTSWVGLRLRSPEGREGVCVRDDNSAPHFFRKLTVRFEDGSVEVVTLSNTGVNPERARAWQWLYDGSEWVEFGIL
jgi:hypothetical protein